MTPSSSAGYGCSQARTGVTVPPERKPFLVTGLRRRMRETGHGPNSRRYYDELFDGARGAMEWAALVDRLTVHETHFFRHQPSLDADPRHLAAAHVACERARRPDAARAGTCRLLDGRGGLHAGHAARRRTLAGRAGSAAFGVTATDVSQPALAVARNGVTYPQCAPRAKWAADLPRDGDRAGRGRAVPRQRVACASAWVSPASTCCDASRAPLRRLDLIFCQNVLIYFARERRIGELLDGLARLLRPERPPGAGPG